MNKLIQKGNLNQVIHRLENIEEDIKVILDQLDEDTLRFMAHRGMFSQLDFLNILGDISVFKELASRDEIVGTKVIDSKKLVLSDTAKDELMIKSRKVIEDLIKTQSLREVVNKYNIYGKGVVSDKEVIIDDLDIFVRITTKDTPYTLDNIDVVVLPSMTTRTVLPDVLAVDIVAELERSGELLELLKEDNRSKWAEKLITKANSLLDGFTEDLSTDYGYHVDELHTGYKFEVVNKATKLITVKYRYKGFKVVDDIFEEMNNLKLDAHLEPYELEEVLDDFPNLVIDVSKFVKGLGGTIFDDNDKMEDFIKEKTDTLKSNSEMIKDIIGTDVADILDKMAEMTVSGEFSKEEVAEAGHRMIEISNIDLEYKKALRLFIVNNIL